MIEKPPVFTTKKRVVYFYSHCVGFLILNLGFKARDFFELKKFVLLDAQALVLQQYEKDDATILKMHLQNGLVFTLNPNKNLTFLVGRSTFLYTNILSVERSMEKRF